MPAAIQWAPNRSHSIAKLVLLLGSSIPQLVMAAPLFQVFVASTEDDRPKPGSDSFWWTLGLSAILVLLGGVFAGLTLGLMGLDMMNLRVLETSGEEQEQKDSAKVIKLLDKGRHWVLVCLLLSNVIVNETLPLFLDRIAGSGLRAVVLSTTAIVIFGEIIPQALCARYGLRIGAWAAPFVLALMYLEFPIAWPVAKLLDWLLGEDHGTLYKKAELKTFVALHRQVGGDALNEDEVLIISSVLELSAKPVSEIMTPIEDTYTLSADSVLDQATVDQILALGHSRIPIHAPEDPKEFHGMLIVKKLISYDPSQAQPLSSFPLSVLPETGPDSTCLDALNYFQQGRSHILLVSSDPGVAGGAIGVVTLEDVIEEMIGEEIVDETDLYVDLHNKIKVVRGPAKRAATGKELAPLIQGVIERRHARKLYTHEPSASNNNAANGTAIAKAAAFDKMRIKGGGLPERRKPTLNHSMTSQPERSTPSAVPSPAGGSTPTVEGGRTPEENAQNGERTPLLRSSTAN